jgi:Arc/MetJ-type ribon-helix-helix transcriptional regulator
VWRFKILEIGVLDAGNLITMRRKKISEARNVKLFLEDELELKRKVKSGTFKTFSDAVRQTVSMELTAERLQKYGDDAQYAGFKKRQLEVLEPLNRGMTDVNKELQEVKAEITESRKIMRDFIDNIRGQNTSSEKASGDEFTRNKLLKFDNFFGQIMEQLNFQKGQLEFQTQLTMRSREDAFVMRSMLLFFTLGYHAGKIKPAKVLDEPAFLKMIEDATGEVIKEARRELIADGNNRKEDMLIKQMVQSLINKLYKVGESKEE